MNFLKIQNWYLYYKAKLFTRLLKKQFGAIGEDCLIIPPLKSNNLKEIFIGNQCRIQEGTWIDCIKKYRKKYEYDAKIEIGNNAKIGRFAHIIACGHMKIGNNVTIAERVYITDNIHGYEDINVPIMEQPLKHAGPVRIGDGVWIGDGVSILPNVTIGERAVVGCNSVVTKDVPPYSVAAGIPATIIRSYDRTTEKWEKVC